VQHIISQDKSLLILQLSSSRESYVAPAKASQPYDLDLSLQTQWYARSPVILPPSIVGNTGKSTYASNSGWTSSGPRKTHTYSAVVQHSKDLSRHKIHLIWDASNPCLTVKAQQKYISPPRALTPNELEIYKRRCVILPEVLQECILIADQQFRCSSLVVRI
jgi:hypothetical protein